jgi:acyl-CoA synthetase (AMP-forming)/AMP-acid ligase II
VLAADGWLTTGDFGLLTPAGNLQLSGRAHERYIRGGYNVYPAEVEEVLATHPAVARVAVVGTPDPSWARSAWPLWWRRGRPP